MISKGRKTIYEIDPDGSCCIASKKERERNKQKSNKKVLRENGKINR